MGESIEIIDRVVPEKPEDFVSKPRLYLHNPLHNPPLELHTLPSDLHNPLNNPPLELENRPPDLDNLLENPLETPPLELENPLENFRSAREPERMFVIWSDYARVTGMDERRSNGSLYNDLHSAKLGLNIKPVTMGNKKRYYCVEVTDSKLIEKARSLGIRDMTPMVLREGNSSSGENLEFSKKMTRKNVRDDTKILDSLSSVIKEEGGKGELGGIELTLSDYIKYFGSRRTKRSIYRRVHQPDKFPFLVYPKLVGRRIRYLVRIVDARMIEIMKILESEKEKSSNKEDIISVRVRVPERLTKVINLILCPRCPDYEQFHKFIKEGVMTGRLNNNLSTTFQIEAQRYIKKDIEILRKDYESLKQMAKFNNLNISKLLTMLLKGYLICHYPNNFLKGGQYGDMLSTC